MAVLRLPSEGPGSYTWWTGQIEWAEQVRKDLLPSWQKLVRAYCDKLTKPTPESIRVNIEFEKTEQKRHLLFYRLPALKLRPHPRTMREAQSVGPDGQPRDLKRAVSIFREVLSRLAGPKGAHTKAVMDEVIFDVLCPAGLGAVKVGYERFEDGTVEVETGEFQPDPAFQPPPGSVLGLGPTPLVPVLTQVPNTVAERYYVSRISPAKLLIPPDFTGSDYAQADWLGFNFWITEADAKKRGWVIPKDAPKSSGLDEPRLTELPHKGQRPGQLEACAIYYYASRVDPQIVHPEKIRQLVCIKGVKTPVIHEDLADQRFDATGRLVGGLRTLPIKVLTLRYVSDSAFPPSDCAISSQQADELSEFRTQMILHRRKALAMRWADVNRIADDKVKDKILHGGAYYDTIPTDGPGDKIVGEVARAQYPRENYTANDYLMDDINRLWSLGASQSGVIEGGATTATEIAAIREATANRLGAERDKVVGQFWVSIMEALGSLVQLYADREDYVEIVGEDGTRAIEAWDRDTIRGDFLYDVVPNSAEAPDAAADRDLALNRYNLLANDPFVNREQLVRDTMEAFDGDPDRLVHVPSPPPPDTPRVNVSIKGEDLAPMMPQYPNIVNLLKASGVSPLIPPQAGPPDEGTGPAGVVDRERLRMAEADERDRRFGGLAGATR